MVVQILKIFVITMVSTSSIEKATSVMHVAIILYLKWRPSAASPSFFVRAFKFWYGYLQAKVPNQNIFSAQTRTETVMFLIYINIYNI